VKFFCGSVPPMFEILEVIGFAEELVELKGGCVDRDMET
jgi:hypothetical protein